MRLLAKDPADRYPDAYAVLRDLDQVFPAGEAPRRRRDSRLSFGTSGPLEAQGKPSVPPPSLASWKGFVTRSRRLEVEGRRRILYEVEELVGQLDSLVDMMEQISTVMEMKQDAHREEGRRIRHAIDKFAQSVSIKRGTLQDLRQEFDALAAEMSELDRQIAVHVVNLQVSGRIEIGARLDERLVASCADLGNLAHGWMEHNARLAGLRKKGQTLSKQIRDNEMQIDALRERLGSVLLEASAAIETEQARIDSLEEERSRIETRLCGLAVDIVRAA